MSLPAWLHPDFRLTDDAGTATAADLIETGTQLADELPLWGRAGLAATNARAILSALLAAEARQTDLFLIRDATTGAEIGHRIEGDKVFEVAEDAPDGTGLVWLQTSGSTGRPKWVSHPADALRARIAAGQPHARWLLSYAAAGFAGLQVILSAAIGGHHLVVPPAHAAIGDLAALAVEHDITHLSGTPTFWRAFLMALGTNGVPLATVTLGGEATDQALLDLLRAKFPKARLRHLYATTELGTVFSVADGRAGFPAEWLENGLAITEHETLAVMRDGALRDTGDRVAVDGDRVLFRGRLDAMVNVGGVKIWPEEVETHLLRLPFLRDALVTTKPNPITGSILIAELVLADPDAQAACDPLVKAHLALLPRAARPAMIRYRTALPTGQTGKKLRMP
jgi:acyl-coenzyme A synthetase/AMP-(fatty) acid ligase